MTGQYRARTRDARSAALLRTAVLAEEVFEVDEFEADLVPVGAVADAVEHALRWSGTTAFLTSTNGQAMLVAREIADTGAFAELRRRAGQKVLASWLGTVFRDWPALSISRDELAERLVERLVEVDPAAAWRALRDVAGTKGTEVDLTRLVPRLRGYRPLQPELLHQQDSDLIVSTVHRAKGLEFDNVVLVDFAVATWNKREELPSAAVRRKFVALTRATGQIVRADGPKDWNMHRCADGRWYRGGPKKFHTFGFELRVDDLDRTQPHGLDPTAVQEYLRTSVNPGDLLTLRLDVRRSDLRLPVYSILHGATEVARTSEEFGHRFVGRIRAAEHRKSGLPWPGLAGLRTDGIRTVAGEPADGPVGKGGLWLGISAAGMLDLEWKDDRA